MKLAKEFKDFSAQALASVGITAAQPQGIAALSAGQDYFPDVLDFIELAKQATSGLGIALADNKVTLFEGANLLFATYPALNKAIVGAKNAVLWFANTEEQEIDRLFSEIPAFTQDQAWQASAKAVIYLGVAVAEFGDKKKAA